MSASSAVVDGLALLNGSIGFLGSGATIGNISSSANNANLDPILRGVLVTGNDVQLGASVASMFSVASAVVTQGLTKANAVGQTAVFAADL